jgi:hypothetical protein
MLAPLENLVTVVSGYDLCSNRQHRQSDLFVPLAAIRILLVAVNKQVSPTLPFPPAAAVDSPHLPTDLPPILRML